MASDTPIKPAVWQPLGQPGFLREMLLTLMAALLTGLSGGLLLILLVFGINGAEAAESADSAPTRGQLTLHTLDGRDLQQAPLLKTEVVMAVSGMLTRVKVVQQFRNPGSEWMEGIYQFPLPPGSAVERLRLVIGERIIEGHIEEKQKAKQVYQKAKAAGQRASLLSQQRPNIFTTSVANIAPGETLQVEIGYQQQVHYADGQFELRFPLVVGPRYIPGVPVRVEDAQFDAAHGWAQDTDQVPDATLITPPVASPAEGPLNPVGIRVILDTGLPLRDIKSHYHPVIEHQQSGGVIELELAEGPVPADRDFLLSWRPQVGMEPRAALFSERWQDEDYALLLVMPPDEEVQAQKLAREIIFVIDNSGSMHGASISQARAALRLALSRLGPGDRFNLIHFNNQSYALFKQARQATEANKQQALRTVESLQAEGGTEMLPALSMALAGDAGGQLRQIIFLTDGSVGNEEALFELIRRRLGESRLFTIGIGSAPNSHFMQRAADFGRGSFTYIGDLSEVEARMRSLFEKLEFPAMRNLRVTREDGESLEVLPSRLPDLYLGEPLLLALKSPKLDGNLIIEGERDGTPWRHTIDLKQGGGHQDLHRLWARRRIKAMMGQGAAELSADERRQAVTSLALRHQLVSAYTSLVAVEKQPVRPASEPLKGGMMPLNLPQGWDAAHVFGKLPQTATPAPLLFFLGLLLMGGGLWLRRRVV
ncbi:MAG: marine proteobacterial sortase target protein [Candidatus Thiodiazotropha sp.]